jgi:aromatic ring-opening dioxygenase LigB subunit
MVLVNVSILPHGAMLLDMSLLGLPEAVPALRDACIAAADSINDSEPELIILFTPHGICTKTKPGVYLNQSVSGNAGWNGFWETFSICSPCDPESAQQLLSFLGETEDAKAAGITCFSKVCSAPLAWGEVVPLSFCRQTLDRGTQLVVCSWPQLRFHPAKYAEAATAMGKRLHEYAQQHPKRVALMFSCDLSHVHGEPDEVGAIFRGDPTLGVDKALATQFDGEVVRWLETLIAGDVAAARDVLLGDQCMGVVERAKSCGWAGFCAVQGCLESLRASRGDTNNSTVPPTFATAPTEDTPRDASTARSQTQLWNGKLWGYAAPTYFGMLAATFAVNTAVP